METYIVKTEPSLENVEEHEYHIKVIGCKEEQKLKPKCSNTNEINKQPQLPNKNKSTVQKSKTLNNAIKKPSTSRTNDQLFTIYLRKKFLSNFLENDCTSQCLDQCLMDNNVNRGEVKEYYGKYIKEAQRYVYQECDSLCFNNITEWLKHFEATGKHLSSNFEAAVVMNAIVNNEPQPDSSLMGGVNLKSIYKFISNGLLGLPQKPLDSASATFLSNEFQNLINEANTDEADDDVRTLKTKLEIAQTNEGEQHSSNLDPLKLTDTAELLNICRSSYTEETNCNNVVKKEK